MCRCGKPAMEIFEDKGLNAGWKLVDDTPVTSPIHGVGVGSRPVILFADICLEGSSAIPFQMGMGSFLVTAMPSMYSIAWEQGMNGELRSIGTVDKRTVVAL